MARRRGELQIREMLEEIESRTLHPRACLSASSRGRVREEPPDAIRPCFQRDRDRIIHCKAFRRLTHKTQVFLAPAGDHYRTRLTHTLEVAQIARTLAKALRLNETLAEAIAMAHDLGHPPFGHAGEAILDRMAPQGFSHYRQSLRVVDRLENDGRGLNLTHEVRDGIVKHSKGEGEIFPGDPRRRAITLEGQVVRVADVFAYSNADLDDAFRAGLLRPQDVPRSLLKALGRTSSERIATLVMDVVRSTLARGLDRIAMSRPVLSALTNLRSFLFRRVYRNETSVREFRKAEQVLMRIHEYVLKNPERTIGETPRSARRRDRLILDFIAGMTDRYAIALFEEIAVPRPWIGLR
ncbi:MAG TPA: deoxyguanosinetriphosphate triphosphohydrolase [Candidatus Polarisedimenticolia bacterium]|nr:deoxyguanosinetriphosphate triphosphohydrolase [Candidatus Polarisedimenticolia bacterium]